MGPALGQRQAPQLIGHQVQGHDGEGIGVQGGHQGQGQVDPEQGGQDGRAEHLEGAGNEAAEQAHGDAAGRRVAVQVPQPGVQQGVSKGRQPAVLPQLLMVRQVAFEMLAHAWILDQAVAPGLGGVVYAFGMNNTILAFALGVGLVQLAPRLPDWPLGWVVAGLLMLPVLPASLSSATTGAWRRAARIGWIAWSLAFGLAWAAWLAQGRLAGQLPSSLEGVDIPVIGVVASLPQEFPRGLRFEFRLESSTDSRQGPEGLTLPENLLLSWYGTREAAAPTLVPGQRWQLTLRLKRPHGNANPHGFDYEAWLLERNLRATGYVRTATNGPASPRLLGSASGLPLVIEQLRFAVRERFRAWLPEADYPYGGILTALAVGDQRAIAGQEWRIFARTGTTHLMSVSGLHITLVAALGAGLAGWLWRRWPRLLLRCPARRMEIIAGWWVAGAYTLLAGSAVPALRTWAMLTAAALALLSGRVVGAGKVLSFALLAVLLYDPWAVLAPGFWLSFVVSKGITVPFWHGYTSNS